MFVLLQTFSNAIIIKFSSIDMKTSGKKTVQELKGELKLITATEATWAIWMRFFYAHKNGNLVNPDSEKPYKSDTISKILPILKEFFHSLQGLQNYELYKTAQHILLETSRRSLPYPKIFLKRPKHMKIIYVPHQRVVRIHEEEDNGHKGDRKVAATILSYKYRS